MGVFGFLATSEEARTTMRARVVIDDNRLWRKTVRGLLESPHIDIDVIERPPRETLPDVTATAIHDPSERATWDYTNDHRPKRVDRAVNRSYSLAATERDLDQRASKKR